ncbi:hypothetical protein CIY_27100 [Butyrivibrio fibrisolvens 16/4]|nr:hypothetical protein CIY_27100 [Butyrivibrio fibrisolvens 16/4]
MNILFISLQEINSINERGIYTDLLRQFRNLGHEIYVISPVESRNGKETTVIDDGDAKILRLTIGNIQKTNAIEKGITTLTIEHSLIRGIKKYFADVKFDLVLYPTPPITFCGAAEYVKNAMLHAHILCLKIFFHRMLLI